MTVTGATTRHGGPRGGREGGAGGGGRAGGNGVAGVQERDASAEVHGDGDGVLPVLGPSGERGHGVRKGGREEADQAREE